MPFALSSKRSSSAQSAQAADQASRELLSFRREPQAFCVDARQLSEIHNRKSVIRSPDTAVCMRSVIRIGGAMLIAFDPRLKPGAAPVATSLP